LFIKQFIETGARINMENYFINIPSNQIPQNLTTDILSNSNSVSFHKTIPLYKPTPLTTLPALAKHFGVQNILVKDESYRFGLNAFKGLGASFAINEILKKNPRIRTFCTATDGNHGRSVAWSSKRLKKHSVVYVPKNTSEARIDAIKKEGANVLKVNGNYDETCAHAKKVCDDESWQLMQDTAWEGYEEVPAYIMAGYLTHFIELEESLHSLPNPKIDVVFLQAGVGSWAASAIWYYLNRYGADRPKLVIVEPTASNGILTSFKKGYRSEPTGNLNTIMAGLNCGVPSTTAWEIIQNGVDASIAVSDSYAKDAMKILYNPTFGDQQIIAGESGVGGFAGFMALMLDKEYKNVKDSLGIKEDSNILFFSTEGATDPNSFSEIVGENIRE
jgi:diaminopropionate ammonia-lyase